MVRCCALVFFIVVCVSVFPAQTAFAKEDKATFVDVGFSYPLLLGEGDGGNSFTGNWGILLQALSLYGEPFGFNLFTWHFFNTTNHVGDSEEGVTFHQFSTLSPYICPFTASLTKRKDFTFAIGFHWLGVSLMNFDNANDDDIHYHIKLEVAALWFLNKWLVLETRVFFSPPLISYDIGKYSELFFTIALGIGRK